MIQSVIHRQRTKLYDILKIKTKSLSIFSRELTKKISFCMWNVKMNKTWSFLNTKIAKILPFERFLVIFFTSKAGNHIALNWCAILFATEQIFPRKFCIRPLWNAYIPLFMDCVVYWWLCVRSVPDITLVWYCWTENILIPVL